jgi:hypothetical protein
MGILRTKKISGLETPTPVTGSVSFDGTGDTLTVTSSDFSFGTGDFTIECWYNLTATPTNFYIFDFGSNGMRFQIYDSGSGPIVYMMTSTSTYVNAPANSYATVGQWYHIAMTRRGTTVTGFINGISQGTQTVADNFTHTALTIGNYGGGGDYEFTGYLSNFRILKGTALYTSNFTPPVNELQRIGDTVLLCCNNPDSAGAEATGKTITVNGNAAASTFSPGLTRDFTFGTQFEGVGKFDTQGYFVPPSGTTENRFPIFPGGNAGTSARALWAGGSIPSGNTNIIDYVTIASLGNATSFGSLTAARRAGLGAVASSTRGVWAGGSDVPGAPVNTIDYVTITSIGDAVDFGDLTTSRYGVGAFSSSTRGIFVGGFVSPANTNTLDYITIASTGNSIDFGDLNNSLRYGATCSSPTRGICAGGFPTLNAIDYVTIASTGIAVDFGDLITGRNSAGGCSNSTRGLFAGGGSPGSINLIDYITIASTGNAVNFGNLSVIREPLCSGAASQTRGVWGGGYYSTPAPAGFTNIIDYVTISSLGNAASFGSLSTATRYGSGACSNGHGGLG